MSADPTLDLDLAAVTDESRRLAAAIKPTSARPSIRRPPSSIPRDTGNLTIRPYSVVSEQFLDEATE